MKEEEQARVPLAFKMVQATRIRDEFGRFGEIAGIVDSAINEALRQEARATQKAPDDALIPVRVDLTLKQAKIILDRFRPYAEFPTDGAIYWLVKNAMDQVSQ